MSGAAPARGPIVLVGAELDDHVSAIREAVRARGVEPIVVDTLLFPGSTKISLGATAEEICINGVQLGRPGAVYLRSLYLSPLAYLVDVAAEMEANWRTTMIVFKEKGELLLSLVRRWEDLNVPIYNSLSASELTRKPYQIALLQAAGLPVPQSLWTNDPQAVLQFAQGRRIAYKPVSGGASTKELRAEDLDAKRLARLSNAPVTFQELLPGEDMRIFVLDDRVLASFRIEVEEGVLDYRQHEQKIQNVPIDDALAGIARRAARVLGLRFTGIDLKRAADGSWRLLELNPSPMFLGFDHRAGTDILGSLADALIAGPEPRTGPRPETP